MKNFLSAGVLLCTAALGTGCVIVDSQGQIVREEKRFTVTGKPELQLATFDGSIEIRPGDEKTVLVEIEKRGPSRDAIDKLQVEAKQDGNRITVEVKKPSGDTIVFGIGHLTPTASLVVTVPHDANIVARSGDGSIRAERIRGKIELHTGDGSIALESVDGALDLDTGDGSVSVSGSPDALKVHTGDGSVTVRAERATKMTDDWSISTGDGGVVVYLPQDFGAELDASTGGGSIKSDLNVSGDGEETSKRVLRGRLGGGGKRLRIDTGDGSIRLRSS